MKSATLNSTFDNDSFDREVTKAERKSNLLDVSEKGEISLTDKRGKQKWELK